MKIFDNISKTMIILTVFTLGLFISSVSVLNMSAPKPVYGHRLSVDGVVWGIFESEAVIEATLDAYKNQFLKRLDENVEILRVEFDAEFELEEVETPTGVLNDPGIILDHLNKKKEQAVYYTVQPGDSIWAISINEQVSIADIMTYNPDLDIAKIWPNDQIMIESEVPAIDVVVTLESVELEAVAFESEFIEDDSLYRSQRVVVKPGVEGEKEVTYHVIMRNGYLHEVNVEKEVTLVEPTTSVIRIGTMATLRRGGGNNYGVVTGRLTSGFGYRKDPFTRKTVFHNAIDIGASYGTPIKAYTNGKVILAGWNGMGGNMVIIDHGNGLHTEYAHMSSITVKKGQQVSVGQVIGKVGSTGYSTGNHLHFSVRVNGTYVNPLNYI